MQEQATIDRSFIGRVDGASEDLEIVRAIMSLAENMGMNVVAEGVETLGQLRKLLNLKCEYGQGYLFSRPVDGESVTRWISREPEWLATLVPLPVDRVVPMISAVA